MKIKNDKNNNNKTNRYNSIINRNEIIISKDNIINKNIKDKNIKVFNTPVSGRFNDKIKNIKLSNEKLIENVKMEPENNNELEVDTSLNIFKSDLQL